MPSKALHTIYSSKGVRNLSEISELSATNIFDLRLLSAENKFYWVMLERSFEWQRTYLTILHFTHFISAVYIQKKMS